ncbi:MAG: c-type cytochrome [Cytophagaceae bacterium]|nr:c-type cytochrome [Cytophagaceae bacterium]MBK9933496.1 c-type cytochrome [Cytophagaceae bacterium]MBL0302792.1 c-type cytochrome [Cytophagaceae bacterium]MBL0325613.1 c-type cytochrome [Cytophagaceae bacterium]
MLKKAAFLFIISIVFSCKSSDKTAFDRFPEGKTKELITVEGIDVPDSDLQLSLFAKEPDVFNPTNMDIDHKGRVWVTEAYNYRNEVNNIPYEKKGDQILILEDTNQDGKIDKKKLYYQGEDVNSALGIVVLGNKVIVSCSPNALVFTDENGDDVPDKKEILFKTKGGLQSDHGLHAFVFGPDGKLYFNFGNFGEGLLDKNGNPIKDIYGRVIDQTHKPFQDGMSVRCDIDGTNFEVLGWNFRNQYELCVDSYGRIWQSDNDDDGKRSNRINYMLPNGNYGYKDEVTFADWRVSRTNMEDSVWNQHWHQNDPGVVPNLKITGAGSPTGILMYEGDFLPKKYHNTLFLADAGTNEVFSYGLKNVGAGYETESYLTLDAKAKDMWFRPSDLCVAPDGSVLVADWYDTGVGGHFVGDLERGRIYRISPKNAAYLSPKYDYSKISGAVEALKNPNHSVRYLAYQTLKKAGKSAESELLALTKSDNPVYRSRAYWILKDLDKKYVISASTDGDERIRAAAVRMVEGKNEGDFLLKMSKDPSWQVKEAIAGKIYLKNMPEVWVSLANSYKSGDRWFLEALGNAADQNWNNYLAKYLQGKDILNNNAVKDIIWRSRADITSDYLVKIIQKTNFQEAQRYFRAFDFQAKKQKNEALLKILKSVKDEPSKLLIFKHFDPESIVNNPEFHKILPGILAGIKNEMDFLDVVSKYNLTQQKPRLMHILENSEDKEVYERAAGIVANMFNVAPLKQVLLDKPFNQDRLVKMIKRLGLVDTEAYTRQLILIFSNPKYPFKIREAAMLAMEGYSSDVKLWNLIKINKVDKDLIPAAKIVMSKTFHNDLKIEFEQRFGKPEAIVNNALDFKTKIGDVKKGKELYDMYCLSCHQVGGKGIDFGPDLSLIGKKLTKESMYNAIVNPNQGISFGYEGFTLELNDGSSVTGLLTSKTADSYMIKVPGSSEVAEYKKSLVKNVIQMKVSMMPAFPLQEQEYIDMMEYLSGLK